MYGTTWSRPPRPPAGVVVSIAAARRIWYAPSASKPVTPLRYASATTSSALAPIIVPASPVAIGHLGKYPLSFAFSVREDTQSSALSGATREYIGLSVRYVSQRDMSER